MLLPLDVLLNGYLFGQYVDNAATLIKYIVTEMCADAFCMRCTF
jgi:hypothetical protein